MAQSGKLQWGNVLTVLSATVLVATQAIATAVAAGWAVAGLFRLGDIGEYVLIGGFGALAVYVSVLYFRRAARIEPLTQP